MEQIILFSLSEEELTAIVTEAVSRAMSDKRHWPAVMTKKQLAAYLGKPTSTIKRWMDQGMPYYKVDEASYPEFYKRDVDEWLERRFRERVIELRRVA